VTRDELHRLVVDELATKRWLHHPELEEQRSTLQRGLAEQANRRRKSRRTWSSWRRNTDEATMLVGGQVRSAGSQPEGRMVR